MSGSMKHVEGVRSARSRVWKPDQEARSRMWRHDQEGGSMMVSMTHDS